MTQKNNFNQAHNGMAKYKFTFQTAHNVFSNGSGFVEGKDLRSAAIQAKQNVSELVKLPTEEIFISSIKQIKG